MKTIARILVTIVLGCAVFLTSFHPTATGYARPESRDAEANQGRIRLNIGNGTGRHETITVTLVGPETHVLEVRFNVKIEILPGTYRFSYTACNKKKYGGVFTANYSPYHFKLPHCSDTTYLLDPPAKTSRVYVRNETGSNFTIYFSGSQNYEWLIEPGTADVYLEPGKYNWSVYSHCGIDHGEVLITSRTFIWIWYCGRKMPELD